ncbi:hypothetical protein JOC25_000998 [Solibacillus kalamii]|uniref:Uncharacterized protein n=1 Tax=Solibacillus kalamii TaxID=1748298 RepID=A0ABX3ZJ01_9BACL|nr:hypothetical protein [Solibacillus kalamii]MBM7664542.1 hypothetical protein [Solibacillus kalamii]OUZ39709.1 hypothetical protein CBM15_04155 [Solibacillus kalamii]
MRKLVTLCLIIIILSTNFGTVEASVENINNSELELYKQLYENQLEANNRVLTTVYFALSFAGTFIVLFLAGNFWVVNKSREKEFEALQSKNQAELLNIKNSLLEYIKSEFEKYDELQKVEIENTFDELAEEIEKYTNELEEKLDECLDKLSELKEDLVYETASRNYQNGDYLPALHNYMKYLNLELERGNLLDISLEEIWNCLNKIDSPSLMIDDVNELNELIDSLPSKYSIWSKKIKARLNEMPTLLLYDN